MSDALETIGAIVVTGFILFLLAFTFGLGIGLALKLLGVVG